MNFIHFHSHAESLFNFILFEKKNKKNKKKRTEEGGNAKASVACSGGRGASDGGPAISPSSSFPGRGLRPRLRRDVRFPSRWRSRGGLRRRGSAVQIGGHFARAVPWTAVQHPGRSMAAGHVPGGSARRGRAAGARHGPGPE